jgi:glycosyltransferase involved in cell wall biosynthesis
MDPRPNQNSNFNDLLRKKKQENIKIIQRVGDLGTHGKPELLELVRNTAKEADHVIFPSNWAKSEARIKNENIAVIQNAPLPIFVEHRKVTNIKITEKYPVNLITHHWSDNFMKGFDSYEVINDFCANDARYTFTFMGRKPEHIKLNNHIPPQDAVGISKILPKYDVYVTASKKEAGANHVLEAIALGLPVLYHKDGGSINEYCEKYGLMYENNSDLINILKDVETLQKITSNIPSYSRTTDHMALDYVDLIEKLYEN